MNGPAHDAFVRCSRVHIHSLAHTCTWHSHVDLDHDHHHYQLLNYTHTLTQGQRSTRSYFFDTHTHAHTHTHSTHLVDERKVVLDVDLSELAEELPARVHELLHEAEDHRRIRVLRTDNNNHRRM